MSGRDSPATQAAPPSRFTNAHFQVVNLVMLASIIVEWLVCTSVGGAGLATVVLGSSTVLYFLFFLLAPRVIERFRPGVSVERKGVRLVGVFAYGAASLAFILSALASLFG